MECLHLFKAAKFGSLKMHVLCRVGKNIIFQNKIFLVMFYRQNKTFWYQFCNSKHFLKAENSEDSCQFVTQQANGLFCHSTWVEWLLALVFWNRKEDLWLYHIFKLLIYYCLVLSWCLILQCFCRVSFDTDYIQLWLKTPGLLLNAM